MATNVLRMPRTLAHVLVEIDRDMERRNEAHACERRAAARGDEALAEQELDFADMMDAQIAGFQHEADEMIRAALGIGFDDLQRRLGS